MPRLIETVGGTPIRLTEHPGHPDQKVHGRRGSGMFASGSVDLMGDLSNFKPIAGRGMNASWVAEIDGHPVFVKEVMHSEGQREIAASALNEVTGEPLISIPRVVSRVIPNPRGYGGDAGVVVQEFVGPGYMRWGEVPSWFDKSPVSARHDVAVFDFVTANEDRHKGNLMVNPKGHLVAIDNGLTFSDKFFPRGYIEPTKRVPLNERQKKWLTTVALTDPTELAKRTGLLLQDARAVRDRAAALRKFGFVATEKDIGRQQFKGGFPSDQTASQQPLPLKTPDLRIIPIDIGGTSVWGSFGKHGMKATEALLQEHPGHASQKVHGHRGVDRTGQVPIREVVIEQDFLRGLAQRHGWSQRRFTPAEREAVISYQGDGFRSMNAGLRSGASLSRDDEKRVRALDSAFSKVPGLEEGLVVHRGYAQHEPKGRFVDPGFVSTAATAEGHRSGGYLDDWEIEVPAGTKAIFLPGPNDELLLPRGLTFEVTGSRAMRVVGVLGEALLQEHPGHSDQKVHGRRSATSHGGTGGVHALRHFGPLTGEDPAAWKAEMDAKEPDVLVINIKPVAAGSPARSPFASTDSPDPEGLDPMSDADLDAFLSGGRLQIERGLGGGVSGSFVASIDGAKAVVKPVSQGFFKGAEYKHPGDETDREVGARVVNDLMGGLVPMPRAVARTLTASEVRMGAASGKAAVIEWVEGKTGRDARRDEVSKAFRDHPDFQGDVAVFDQVMGDSDRHEKNWMITTDGKPMVIDSSLSFGDWPVYHSWSTQGRLTPRQTSALRGLVGKRDAAVSALAPMVGEKRARKVIARAKVMLDTDVNATPNPVLVDNILDNWDSVWKVMEAEIVRRNRLLRATRLMEHPGHQTGTDQSVHAGKRLSPRSKGVDIVRGKQRQYPTDDPTRVANLPAEHVAKLRSQLKADFGVTEADLDRNIEAQLIKGLADPDSRKGLGWYGEAHDEASRIASESGISDETAVAMVAAQSPQHEWGSNAATARYTAKVLRENPKVPDLSRQMTKELIVNGERVKVTRTLEEWSRSELAGQRPSIALGSVVGSRLSDHPVKVQASLIKAMSQAGYGTPDGKSLTFSDEYDHGKVKGAQWSCGLDGIAKSIRIFHGEPPDQVLNGHKVRSFNNNMLAGHPSEMTDGSKWVDVTIDTHAVSAAVGKKYAATSPQMSNFTGKPSLASHGTVGLYPLVADSYRRVAEKFNLRPEQAQAVVWLQWRKDNP